MRPPEPDPPPPLRVDVINGWPQYICYNRKLDITLNFMFPMYDKKMYKCDVTCSLPPPLSQTVTPPRTPSPPRAWRTLWTDPYYYLKYTSFFLVRLYCVHHHHHHFVY